MTMLGMTAFIFGLWCGLASLECKNTLICFGTNSSSDVKLMACGSRSWIDPCGLLWLTNTKVHFIKWITWRAETDCYRMFSLGWLQRPVNAFPITLHRVLSQFPCFSSHLSVFGFFFSLFSYFKYHMSCYFSVSVPLSQYPLSTLHSISLMLNVIPPFFRLWFRWHLPRVAVIAKCRLGRWDIGQPLPLLPFHPSFLPSLLSGMAVPQLVLNSCWVFEPVIRHVNCKMQLAGIKYCSSEYMKTSMIKGTWLNLLQFSGIDSVGGHWI